MAANVNKNTKELIKFILVGGIMTAINFLLLALFVEICGINKFVSNVVSYIIVVVVSYFINEKITFNQKSESNNKRAKKLIKFIIMKLGILGIDTLLLFVLVDNLYINLYISKVILTITLTLASFMISKKIITKE